MFRRATVAASELKEEKQNLYRQHINLCGKKQIAATRIQDTPVYIVD